MTRMTTDVDALSTFLQTGLATALVSVLTFVGVLVALVLLDAQLALVLVAHAAGAARGHRVVPAGVGAAPTSRPASGSARSTPQFQENVAGVRVAQAFRREERQRRRASSASRRDYRDSRLRAQRYIATYFPFVQLLADLSRRGWCSASARTGSAHGSADRRRADRVLPLHRPVLRPGPAAVAGLRRLPAGHGRAVAGCSDLLRTPTCTPQPPSAAAGRRRCAARSRSTDVDFALPGDGRSRAVARHRPADPGRPDGRPGRRDRRRQVDPGQAGRPVLRPDRRHGPRRRHRPARSCDLTGYRHRLGVVPQEAYLFPGTVRDAIAYGRPRRHATPRWRRRPGRSARTR